MNRPIFTILTFATRVGNALAPDARVPMGSYFGGVTPGNAVAGTDKSKGKSSL